MAAVLVKADDQTLDGLVNWHFFDLGLDAQLAAGAVAVTAINQLPVLYENGNLLAILANVLLELLELGVVHGREQIGGCVDDEAADWCFFISWCFHCGFSSLLFCGCVDFECNIAVMIAKRFRSHGGNRHENSNFGRHFLANETYRLANLLVMTGVGKNGSKYLEVLLLDNAYASHLVHVDYENRCEVCGRSEVAHDNKGGLIDHSFDHRFNVAAEIGCRHAS
ncbi:hypothetical protein X949_3507 [Burkholderia pseudomallei MSHR5609]|nr:hypothetical protein DO62_4614 [Burkholderia pseudomallei]KGS57447.1 hypothetical protein X949_3507 [Burkholderia pseudomallei MSHR5609]